MNYPLPISLLQKLSGRLRYPALTVGLALLVLLITLYSATGALFPDQDLYGYDSRMQVTGQFLVFTLTPPYLLACLIGQAGATPGIIAALSPLLPYDQRTSLGQLDQIRYWHVGVLIGVANALLFNVPWSILSFTVRDSLFVFSLTMVFAQLLTWAVVGLLLAWALHNALLLYHIGRFVKVDLFHLDALNPFGQSALRSLLIVVGALAITPLQAIDQEFRWVNYQNAVVVGIPAMLLLTLVPIWSVHQQIRASKREELHRIDVEIASSSRDLGTGALTRLNALLDRRRHVLQLRNWPMDVSLFSRIVLYVLIPPLAWAGAALVELAVDSYLAG